MSASDIEKARRVERALLELAEACWECGHSTITEIAFTPGVMLPHVPSPWAEGETRHPHELEALAVPKPVIEGSAYDTDFNSIRLRVVSQ